MTAATPATAESRQAPPTPEECEHSSPVRGVMAHEFSPYSGAQGPEGVRRTTMHYGPVVGGLPISAWHCETCGLLRLEYPDGRREERRLWPGPQPGLLAVAVAEEQTAEEVTGRQARVSGLSASPELLVQILPPAPPPFRITLPAPPAVDPVTGLTVTLLSLTALGLLLGGVLAVYDWTTPGAITPLAISVGACFAAVLLLQVGAAAQRHFLPAAPLRPSIAVSARGRPVLDPATRVAVACFSVVALGLVAAGILAVYDWTTPGAEWPLAIGLIVVFCVGLATLVLDATRRYLSRR